MALRINVACARGCDLRGRLVLVSGPHGAVATGEVKHFDGASNETDEIACLAPKEAGACAWSVQLLPHEPDNDAHEASSRPLCFSVVPHTVSLAAWDVPSPLCTAASFYVKVGARCSAECHLAGSVVEVSDETGTRSAEGILGNTPWPGTQALYWTTVELPAPRREGFSSRSIVLVTTDMGLPHEGAPLTFSFWADKVAEHRVTITVVDDQTGGPVGGVEVRVGRYVSSTDEQGVATIVVPQGTFEVGIRRDGYGVQPFAVDVNDTLAMDIHAVRVPTRAEMDDRLLDDYPWG